MLSEYNRDEVGASPAIRTGTDGVWSSLEVNLETDKGCDRHNLRFQNVAVDNHLSAESGREESRSLYHPDRSMQSEMMKGFAHHSPTNYAKPTTKRSIMHMTDKEEFRQAIDEEKNKIEEEKKAYYKKMGWKFLWKPEVGNNEFRVLSEKPRDHDFEYGPRKLFTVKPLDVNVEYTWAINPKNPIYKVLIKRLSKGQKQFTLERIGTGLDTRYHFIDTSSSKKYGLYEEDGMKYPSSIKGGSDGTLEGK